MTPHTILRAAQARTLRRIRKVEGRLCASIASYHMAKIRWRLEVQLRATERQRASDKLNKELLKLW